MRQIKYVADAENIYVKLLASAEKLAAGATDYLSIFFYDVVDGSGDGYYGWWKNAAGNNECDNERTGVISGTDLTLHVNGVPAEVVKEVSGDDVLWTITISRSSHVNLSASEVNFAVMTYCGWDPNGALPDKYDNMLKVVLP